MKNIHNIVKISLDIMKICAVLHVMIRGITAEGLWNVSTRGVECMEKGRG